jgi:hypothetical protein
VLEPTDQRAKVSIVEEAFPPMIDVALFSIATTVRGTHRLHLLIPGTHNVNLCLVAANHRPRFYEFHITTDGHFDSDIDKMLPHCRIGCQEIAALPKYE